MRSLVVPGSNHIIYGGGITANGFVVVEVIMAVHLNRFGNARPGEIDGVISTAVHCEGCIRSINSPNKIAVPTDGQGGIAGQAKVGEALGEAVIVSGKSDTGGGGIHFQTLATLNNNTAQIGAGSDI